MTVFELAQLKPDKNEYGVYSVIKQKVFERDLLRARSA